jgi:dTMP kinase
MTQALFDDAPTAPGLFVTIDGPNASGKTSIAAAVAESLKTSLTVHSTRQPSPTDLGDLVRRSEARLRGPALACLVAADRHHQLGSEIGPALASGAIVICDRYIESSLVLQRIDGVETEFIVAINRGIRRPDIRVRLLADEQILAARLAERIADPNRRLERSGGGPARELSLYAEADAVLERHYALPSLVLDTTHGEPHEHAVPVVQMINHRLQEPR